MRKKELKLLKVLIKRCMITKIKLKPSILRCFYAMSCKKERPKKISKKEKKTLIKILSNNGTN